MCRRPRPRGVVDRPSRRTRHPRRQSRPRPRLYRLAAEFHAYCRWRPVESVRFLPSPPICHPPPTAPPSPASAATATLTATPVSPPPVPSHSLNPQRRPRTPPPQPPPPPPPPSPRHSGNAHGARQPVRRGAAMFRRPRPRMCCRPPEPPHPPPPTPKPPACTTVSARRRAPPPSPVASGRVGPSPPRPPHPAPCTNSATTARLRPDRHLHRHPRRHGTAATRTAGSNPSAAAPLCSDSPDRACVIDRPSRRSCHPRHQSRPRPRPYRLAAERHANCQWRPVESVRLPLAPPICPPPPSVALHQWRRPRTPPPPPPPPSSPSWSPHSGNAARPGSDAVGAMHILECPSRPGNRRSPPHLSQPSPLPQVARPLPSPTAASAVDEAATQNCRHCQPSTPRLLHARRCRRRRRCRGGRAGRRHCLSGCRAEQRRRASHGGDMPCRRGIPR